MRQIRFNHNGHCYKYSSLLFFPLGLRDFELEDRSPVRYEKYGREPYYDDEGFYYNYDVLSDRNCPYK